MWGFLWVVAGWILVSLFKMLSMKMIYKVVNAKGDML